MRISDWSSDVCSSDLANSSRWSTITSSGATAMPPSRPEPPIERPSKALREEARVGASLLRRHGWPLALLFAGLLLPLWGFAELADEVREAERSEEHTSELQSLMRISYAVFCLKKQKTI